MRLMAYVYSLQFGVPATGLRFFTVYGPWGRPDMATFKFTQAIIAGQPIDVYNHGDMRRDFTYIDDIVEGVVRVLDRVPAKGADGVQHRVYNIGNHRSEPLLRFIEVLSDALGRKAEMRLLPMQMGDVKETFADISDLSREYGWAPTTPIDVGLPRFVKWYGEYYGLNEQMMMLRDANSHRGRASPDPAQRTLSAANVAARISWQLAGSHTPAVPEFEVIGLERFRGQWVRAALSASSRSR